MGIYGNPVYEYYTLLCSTSLTLLTKMAKYTLFGVTIHVNINTVYLFTAEGIYTDARSEIASSTTYRYINIPD